MEIDRAVLDDDAYPVTHVDKSLKHDRAHVQNEQREVNPGRERRWKNGQRDRSFCSDLHVKPGADSSFCYVSVRTYGNANTLLWPLTHQHLHLRLNTLCCATTYDIFNSHQKSTWLGICAMQWDYMHGTDSQWNSKRVREEECNQPCLIPFSS